MGTPDGMFTLICPTCGWRPDLETPMGVVKAHFETEHGGEVVELELTAICPRDQSILAKRTTLDQVTYWLHVYDCPECKRTYRVRQQKK